MYSFSAEVNYTVSPVHIFMIVMEGGLLVWPTVFKLTDDIVHYCVKLCMLNAEQFSTEMNIYKIYI